MVACMAGLWVLVRLDLANNFSFLRLAAWWSGSTTSFRLCSSKAGAAKRTESRTTSSCARSTISSVWCPATILTRFRLAQQGISRCSPTASAGSLPAREFAFSCSRHVSGKILIEAVRHTKIAVAALCKRSSLLTQDSINEAIREVNVRIGCVDGIEYIPQKRMVEADYLSVTVKQSWQQGVDFHFAALKLADAVHKRDLPKSCGDPALVTKGLVLAHTPTMCVRWPSPKRRIPGRVQRMLEKAGADTADTIGYVLVGAPRHLVSVDGEHSADLAIHERLIESGSGSCLMRTMIECFPTQDDHITLTPSRRGWRHWRSRSCTSSAQWPTKRN